MHIFHVKKRFEDMEDDVSGVAGDIVVDDTQETDEADEMDVTDESEQLEDYFNFSIERLRDADGKDLTSKIDTDLIFEDDDDLIDYLSEVFDYDPDEVDIKEIV
ncbi:MAG: hypothetical protein HC906_18895 [Bacteroidales bacterium]|nr:hypothetical protein [Bacteroidales bacterium]